MNPLNLPGPEFLIFYATLACAVLLALFITRRVNESGPLPAVNDKDPFLLACLRDGPREVVRVAMVGLIDRGLLKVTGSTVTAVSGGTEFGQAAIEREIIKHFRTPAAFITAFDARGVESAAAAYETKLRRLRLLPDEEVTRMRRTCLSIAVAVLLGVGAAKLWVAWLHGRSNVWLLIILMGFAVVMAWHLSGGHRTILGDRYLVSVRGLFSGLRKRAQSLRPERDYRDLLWLTALFGVAAAPAEAYPFAKYFTPEKKGSSCNSGTGCGSSGGSSCGGGGGGCGGCGGG